MADIFPGPQYVHHSPVSRTASLAAYLSLNLLTNTLAPQIPVGQQYFPQAARLSIPAYRQIQDPPSLLTSLFPAPPADTTNIFRPLVVTPIIRKARVQDQQFSNTLLLLTATPPATPPPGKSDFTVPVVKPIRVQIQDNINLMTAELAPQPAIPPPGQTEQPTVPIRPRFRAPDIAPNLLAGTLNPNVYVHRIALMASQANRKTKHVVAFDHINTLLLLTAPVVRPFVQSEMTVPVRRPYVQPQDAFLNTIPLVSQPNTKPFLQTDWPNPVRRQYAAPQDGIPNTEVILTFVNTKPFSQTEHPNPRLNRYSAPVFNIPNITILGPPNPVVGGGDSNNVRVGIVRGGYVSDNPSIGGQF